MKHFDDAFILMIHFDATFWWDILMKHFDETFRFLFKYETFIWDILMRHFDETFWRDILMRHCDETFWWDFSMRHFDEAFWWDILIRNFYGTFWRNILLRHFNETFWWNILMICHYSRPCSKPDRKLHQTWTPTRPYTPRSACVSVFWLLSVVVCGHSLRLGNSGWSSLALGVGNQ